MKTSKNRSFISLFCLLTLTGCPGSGDRLQPDEEVVVSMVGGNICFEVSGAEDYQPADIAINPRGTPYKEQEVIFDPALRIVNGKLCIPPSFYPFPDKGQYIIESVLTSKKHQNEPRRIVAGVDVSHGHIGNISLTDMEILRPYSEMHKP